MTTENFFCGTSGLVLPVPNKQAFPEAYRAGTRLTYYASLFSSLEVNSSFYKIPRAATFARWVDEVPEHFRFTVKLWRGITHVPSLAFEPADVTRFMEAAAGLGAKKGCLLIQLPPSAKVIRAKELEALLATIRRSEESTGAPASPRRVAQWKLAVEFRDKSWYTAATDQLLQRFNAIRVLQDMPTSFNWHPAQGSSLIYMRYHGIAGDYRGGYPEERLKQDATIIKTALQAGKEVYAYFNNTIGDAVANAQFLAGALFPVTQQPA